jgi:hypothetical protein
VAACGAGEDAVALIHGLAATACGAGEDAVAAAVVAVCGLGGG